MNIRLQCFLGKIDVSDPELSNFPMCPSLLSDESPWVGTLEAFKKKEVDGEEARRAREGQ